jgi:hypothetical protein
MCDEICMICLEGENLIKMCKCSMRYHKGCFITWLDNKRDYNCEVCGKRYNYIFICRYIVSRYNRGFDKSMFLLIYSIICFIFISLMVWLNNTDASRY